LFIVPFRLGVVPYKGYGLAIRVSNPPRLYHGILANPIVGSVQEIPQQKPTGIDLALKAVIMQVKVVQNISTFPQRCP
jgi:hypothetical protein